MKINPNHLLQIEAGDGWNLEIQASPNSKPGLLPKKFIIAATNFAQMKDAVSACLVPGSRSYHLVLGANGQDLVQLVPFDHQARSMAGFEADAIIIAIDYQPKTGVTTQPGEWIITVAGNYKQVKVPLYPKEQLDSLLEILALICSALDIKTIHTIDEIYPQGPVTGPAFPLVQVRERLFERTQGLTGGLVVLEEVIQEADLYNTPAAGGAAMTSQPLKPGTPVSILEDYKEWVRVGVIREVDSSPWWLGWVEASKVQSGDYEPEVRGSYLFTADDRQYRFVPAAKGNYDDKKVTPPEDIHFIIMHITTGIAMKSTINTFINPDNEVSAHLVIGRDGRVVQMVPFDHAAYHAGGGYWEEQGAFNWHSIGIEVDNAGNLADGADSVYERRSRITIPEGDYERVRYWRDYKEKPWHSFPQVQLEVTFKIVKALERHFRPIQEILEHERISLLTRTDPGPLFPMGKLRTEVLGTDKLNFKRWRVVGATMLYENSHYQAPKDSYPTWPKQLSDCEVKILNDSCNYWHLIEIVKHKNKSWKSRKGWVRRNDVGRKDGKPYISKKLTFYQDPGDKITPPCLPLKELPAETVVRVQRTEKIKWCLIAVPDHQVGFPFVEGWVRAVDLALIEE